MRNQLEIFVNFTSSNNPITKIENTVLQDTVEITVEINHV
uniref:Uncharacterized protein n=1 Tax=Arundo donax TaxID=35708 RepID=A0A0A8ZR43_ARUDO